MKKLKIFKVITIATIIIGITMISLGTALEFNLSSSKIPFLKNIEKIDLKNVAASMNELENEDSDTKVQLKEIEFDTAPAGVTRIEVYEGMTLEELGDKLNRSLGKDIVAGKGYFIANECINKGVDPYIATAVLLLETGCGSRCSSLARNCNNFGGQKGSPGCNGGSYKAYNSMEEGLAGYIDNLARNYFNRGLTTVESIGPKYAESDTWVSKINAYVSKIRQR